MKDQVLQGLLAVVAVLAMSFVVASLAACSATQQQPTTPTEQPRRIFEETITQQSSARTETADGTCAEVPRFWTQETENDKALVLVREGYGRVVVTYAGDSYQMILDIWNEHADAQVDQYGDPTYSPDCSASYGCEVVYTDGENRVHAFQGGSQHVVELFVPTDGNNTQLAISDAISIAGNIGCPE